MMENTAEKFETRETLDPQSLDLHNHESLVDIIIDNQSVIDAAEAHIKSARKTLDQKVRGLRDSAANFGVLVSKVVARGTNKSLTYQYKNAFKPKASSAKARVKKALGDFLFERLFTTKTDVKLRKGVTLGQLQDVLGDRLREFVDVEEKLTPVPDYRREIAELWGTCTDEQKAVLSLLEDEFCAKPSMSRR